MRHGGRKALVGERAAQPSPAQHGHGLDIDQVRSSDLTGRT
jgi:hypothetical protein